MPLQPQAKTALAVVLFSAGWIVAVSFGSRSLLNYESTPGRIGTVPQNWPGSRILGLGHDLGQLADTGPGARTLGVCQHHQQMADNR